MTPLARSRRVSLILLILSVALAEAAGGFRWAETALAELRMAAAPRAASGETVLVTIDEESLDRFGALPWPQQTHARIDGALADLGASEVSFVVAGAGPEAGLTADRDGLVRRYPYRAMAGGADPPARRAAPSEADLAVNFAIRPDTVPTVTAIGVADGVVPRNLVEGRAAVVGTRRADISVPVYGQVPASTLRVLADETMAQGVAPFRVAVWPLFALVAAVVAGVAASPLRRRPGRTLACLACLALGLEAAGLVLFARGSALLPTPALHAILLGFALTVLAGRFDLRRRLAALVAVDHGDREDILERVISDSSDAIIVFDETGVVTESSRRARSFFGIAPLVGRAPTLAEVLPAELAARAERAMEASRQGRASSGASGELTFGQGGGTRRIEFTVTPSRLTRQRGSRSEEVVVGCLTVRDVTQARQQQARLDHMARFDTMTGAMNRAEFVSRLEGWMRDATRAGEGSAVLVLNLHRLKTINATLGRRVGDEVLCALAERLGALDDRLSEVARLDGDSFAVFCRGVDAQAAEGLAGFLISAAGCPFALEDATVRVGARVGIALVTPGVDPQTLVGNAELAVDEAGQTAGDGLRFFDDASSARQERSRQIERALWSAIDNHELYLAYQPQIRLSDMSFVGAEALVRWEHPTMGRIPPCEFVEIAESSGFIEQLGRWVLEQACREAAGWPEPMTVAVNVSPLQFRRSDVVMDVKRALAASGLEPSRLHLEITESIFVSGSSELIEALHDIRFMGVSLALDDFGSGFSSFGYLSSLPLDKIKLDRMFMRDVAPGGTNSAVVRSVAMLAAELDLELVCEGVETEEQCNLLRKLGIDQAQGYLFSEPIVSGEIVPLLWGESRRDVSMADEPEAAEMPEPAARGAAQRRGAS